MKKFFLIAILCSVSTFLVNAQPPIPAKEQQVQQIVLDVFHALADRDLVQLKYNCTKDILILESGAIWNLDTLEQKIIQNTATDFKRVNTIDFLETRMRGKTAWTTYHNQADVTRNGKRGRIKWLETAILINEHGRWKIKTLHSTLLSRE